MWLKSTPIFKTVSPEVSQSKLSPKCLVMLYHLKKKTAWSKKIIKQFNCGFVHV